MKSRWRIGELAGGATRSAREVGGGVRSMSGSRSGGDRQRMQGGAPGLQGKGFGGQGAAHAADEGGVPIGQGQRGWQVALQGHAGKEQGGEGIAGADGVD